MIRKCILYCFVLGAIPGGCLIAQIESAERDTSDASSNMYILEDWDYFAERLRNEFLALGERRYQRGLYAQAVMEYFSFLYHFPNDKLAPLVHYRIGLAYDYQGERDLARREYSMVLDSLDADPRLKVVCLRQLAKLDLKDGYSEKVLAIPAIEDPYIQVLKGFASLEQYDWEATVGYFDRARKYFPPRAQGTIDSLLADIVAFEEASVYRTWKRAFWTLLPGGGLADVGAGGEALGYAATVVTLAYAAYKVENWSRYIMGGGASLFYMGSFMAASRAMGEANERLRIERLMAIRARYRVDTFWSFAHPAIY